MATKFILEEQILTPFQTDSTGAYYWESSAIFTIIAGESYNVVWDDEEYTCIAEEITLSTDLGICFGNKSIIDIGEDTKEPFIFIYMSDYSANRCFTTSIEDFHTVAIYQNYNDGIVIKNHLGKSVTYGEYNKILLTRSSGNKTIYSEGDAIDNVVIDLDFSEGDMTVKSNNGQLIKSAIINKPEMLIPENIVKDIDIAGVVGTFKGGGGSLELEGDFLKYVAYQLDDENKEIIIYAILWTQLYADTGSYDVNIPSTFGAYQVVIASEGVC